MRIGIDAQFAAYERHGIGRYVVNLIRGLAAADCENEYVIYGPPQAFPELRSKPNFCVREVGNLPYPLWEQVILPAAVRRDRLDVLHCPANTAPLRMLSRVGLVVTLHDVIYLLPASVLPRPPMGRQRLGNLYRRAVVPRSCPRADRILAVSEFTKQQIVEWLPVDAERIRVTYQGVGPAEKTAEACSIEEPPFILALGSHDPRKNTERIIRAYAGLKCSGAIQQKLRIVGLRRWRSSSFYRLACHLKVAQDILFHGDLWLVGAQMIGHFIGYKSGHTLNHKLIRKLLAHEDCWELLELANEEELKKLKITPPTHSFLD